MRRTLFLVCLYFFAFVFPSPVHATRSLTIAADKATLLGDEELHVTASASGFTEGESVYIKGAFVQLGTSNYFGFTKFEDAWIKNSASSTSQKLITIGTWDGMLSVKSDFTDSGYKGEGEYIFKVGFYVGSSSSVTWSTNSLTVSINEPDPTITPTPTNTIEPTRTPTPTSGVTPTATISPATSALAKAPLLTITSFVHDATPTIESISQTAILGVEDVRDDSEASVAGQSSNTKSIAIALLLVSVGIGLFAIASILPKIDIWNKKNDTQKIDL